MGQTAAMVVRITGVLQLVMGILIWMGGFPYLIPVHMLIGVVFVIAMWVLGFKAMSARVASGLAGVLIAWGAIVVAFGMTQAQLWPGPNHAAIQALHMVMGLMGMGLSDMVAKKMRVANEVAPQAPQA
jgi:uncharacterized membrane protein YccC